MREVVLNIAMSLDGFIEGPNGEFDWCFTDQDYGMEEFLGRMDAIFCGRKSYELLMSMGGDTFPEKKKFVFSHSLQKVRKEWTLLIDAEGETIRPILNEDGLDIWLFGGSHLISHMLRLQLVDKLMLAVHPILLGGGKVLFEGTQSGIPLTLVDSKTYNTGLFQLIYKI